jgi:pheromone shutdown-related protein TraB
MEESTQPEINKLENTKTSTTLFFAGKEIVLIGTAHVSKESVTEVADTIRSYKPDTVCVELDAERAKAILRKEGGATDWEKLDIIKVFREGKGFLLLANLVLSSFQRRMGETLGVKPGDELKAAVTTAEEENIRCVYIDREIQKTLMRAWRKCRFFSKVKLLSALLSSAFSRESLSEDEVEQLKSGSGLDGMMAELSGFLPEVKTVLIDERDRYLASKIWDAACEGAGNKKIIAIVGAGHVPGLIAGLEKIASGELSTDITDIDKVPGAGAASKIAGWAIPVIIVGLIAAGFFISGGKHSLELVLRWVLWNGSLAALGSIVALAHPLAILVSFAGAPIATINPFIGVGLFSGVVQAVMRRPRVTDAQTLSDDALSLRGLYRNRITHALIVFFLSSLGGAIGNFISIPALATQLF